MKHKSLFRNIPRLLWSCLNDEHLNRSSAAMAFYFLFIIFPLLIFLNALLGYLNVSNEFIYDVSHFLPSQISEGILSYFNYVTDNQSSTLLAFGLIFTIYSLFKMFDFVNTTMYNIYSDAPVPSLFKRIPRNIILTLATFISVPILLLTIVLGKNIMFTLGSYFNIPYVIQTIWQVIRFPLAAAVVYLFTLLSYRFSSFSSMTAKELAPGAAVSLLLWLIITVIFSYYLDNIGDYSFLYGALGTVIALMIWLYYSAFSFFFGALLNTKIKNYK